jgi:hypothetical protein
MKLFLFSNTIRTFFKNNSFDEYQHRPEVKIHLDAKIKQDLNKNQGEKWKLNAVVEKENTHWTIRVKTRVFLAMKNEVCLPPNQHDVIQPFIAVGKWKRKTESKNN